MDRSGHDHLRLGAHGEDRAADWYRRAGFLVLDRNWRCPEGEIDLVLERDGLVVFCEVKARTSARYGSPWEAVDGRRQARLRRAASRWLAERSRRGEGGGGPVRFDVAAVRGTRVEVLEGAF